MARLILRHEGGESEYQIRGVVTIGRQATNDIPVLDEKASRHHARVMPEGGRFFLEDLGSANGTLLNGAPVRRDPLKHGDVIRIGKARLMFYEDRAQELEGQTVGNYRVHRKIGSDGMGTVYKATQISMDRTVSLKILSDELTLDKRFLKDFLRQARAAARLSHPNVVRVHDFGEAAGMYYFSMEFVEGEDLDAILAREGKVPVRRALEIVRQVASALDDAHAQNVVHRDIKPKSILIDSNGTVKLMGLGLAALAGRRAGDTPDRRAAGTPEYVSPEVAQQKSVDPRSDIYSLGATLFHMVTGRPPYEGPDPAAVIAAHVRDPIPSPGQYDDAIPDSVCRLTETMMSKNPAMRPSPVSVLVEKIDDILAKDAAEVEKPAAPPPPRPKSARTPRRRILRVPTGSPAAYALMGALVVAILGVMAFVFVGRTGGRRTPRRGRLRTSRRGDGGRSASGNGRGRTSRDDSYRIDPEAQARLERAAAARLAEIKKQIADNPQMKQWIGRSLYRLIMDFRGTEAAAEARRMYRDLVGEERAGDLLNSLGPAGEGDGAPAGPVDEKEAQEAFDRARLESLKAEADGEFRTARLVLTTFTARYRGSRREPEARELARRLDERIHRELDRLYRRAEKASSRGDFREADPLLREIIAKDPVGPDRRRAREQLQANETAAAAVYEKALARAAPHFKSFEFDEAARVLREAAPELAGTGYEERLALGVDCTGEGRKLLGRTAEKLAVTRSRPPVFKRRPKPGRPEALRVLKVLDATPKGLRVGEGGIEHVLPWAELASDEIVGIFELLPLTPADRLSLGAVLVGRGSWLPARRQLERARKDALVRGRAERFLAQVDIGMKTERFDFSHFDQGAAWETEAGSKWSVRGGAFVHEDSGVGSATLKTRTYRAADFFVRFEVTFLEPIGALEVQLGSGDESVWFSLGSSGYEARSSAGGGEAKARGKWEMRPNVPHRVASRMTSAKLVVSVDGKALPALEAPALGRIEGHLTFRAQGARLELDNVEVRQVR